MRIDDRAEMPVMISPGGSEGKIRELNYDTFCDAMTVMIVEEAISKEQDPDAALFDQLPAPRLREVK